MTKRESIEAVIKGDTVRVYDGCEIFVDGDLCAVQLSAAVRERLDLLQCCGTCYYWQIKAGRTYCDKPNAPAYADETYRHDNCAHWRAMVVD